MQVLTWQQLGFHGKPIGLLNTAGFFDPLVEFFKHCVSEVREGRLGGGAVGARVGREGRSWLQRDESGEGVMGGVAAVHSDVPPPFDESLGVRHSKQSVRQTPLPPCRALSKPSTKP